MIRLNINYLRKFSFENHSDLEGWITESEGDGALREPGRLSADYEFSKGFK